MATRWRPQIDIDGETIRFRTYAELKRNIKRLLNESESKKAKVFRTRRGKWGEWFEFWELGYKGKPYITKEGWM